MKTLLFVDGCVLRETSRTERLAGAYLQKRREAGFAVQTLVLEEAGLVPLNAKLLQQREKGIAEGDFRNPYFRYAKDFAQADEVVFAVPYWDLSFPSVLKVYLEHLCINGLTFRYSPQGEPVGLTRIQKVTYVTTSGGPIGDRDFGGEYVKGLMQGLFRIPVFQSFRAEGLDVQGSNPQAILRDAIRQVQEDLPVPPGN